MHDLIVGLEILDESSRRQLTNLDHPRVEAESHQRQDSVDGDRADFLVTG